MYFLLLKTFFKIIKRFLAIVVFLLFSCSASKELVDKQNTNKNEITTIKTKEVIKEPLVSYMEVPLSCPKEKNPKIYHLKIGQSELKVELSSKALKINTQRPAEVLKTIEKEKVITLDKYSALEKKVRVPYIPKWVWALVFFNFIYFGWRYKGVFIK